MTPSRSIPSTPLAGTPDRRAGFTVAEFTVASFILLTAISLALGSYVYIANNVREGSYHITLLAKGRAAEQMLTRAIQYGRAVSAYTDHIEIVKQDLTLARIRYVDGDADPEDNILEYDPSVDTAGDEMTVCDLVTPISGEQMFQTLATSPQAAVITFHVGELPPDTPDPNLRAGVGYQGVEVRFTATPRNSRGMTE
jgi:hypothetical protein